MIPKAGGAKRMEAGEGTIDRANIIAEIKKKD